MNTNYRNHPNRTEKVERHVAERTMNREGQITHERIEYRTPRVDTRTERAAALDPDMPPQQLRLHMGELTAQEERTARAAIRWANAHREGVAELLEKVAGFLRHFEYRTGTEAAQCLADVEAALREQES